MRFVAAHTHPANQCPLQSAEGKTMMKNMLSKDSLKKADVKLVEAYVSCPTDTGAEHKGYFTVDADNSDKVKSFFGAMTVDVRQVSKFEDIAKKL